MKRTLLAIIAILMIVSLACSFLKPKSQPTEEPGATLETGDKGKGGEDEATITPADDGDTSGDDGTSEDAQEFSLDDNAFDELDYYRTSFVMRYEKADGTVDETSIDAAYIMDPAAQSMVMNSNGDSIEIIQIGDQTWSRFGDTWIQTSATDETGVAESFGSFLLDNQDFQQFKNGEYKYVGTETIDGIKTRHYSGEYVATWMLGFLGNTDQTNMDTGTVDMWVADESDLPKFTIKMEIVMEGTSNGAPVKYTMTQIVTDINQPFTIEPPPADAVGGLPEDVPLYPDATELTTMGDMTIFTAPDSMDDVADFYNTELESAGWERTDNMELESMITSQWVKEGRTLSLNITMGDADAGTSVMIVIGEE